MCWYMEEETSLYRTLYGGKLFVKSESMKLLNEAFRDFASEIFLLDQEYQAMQCVHSSLAQRRHFCLEYQKRVDMLNALGTHLGGFKFHEIDHNSGKRNCTEINFY